MHDVFIVTGEASGDAVGAGVAACLQLLRPQLSIGGIGAARMKDAGVHLWENSKQWAAIGIVQALPMVSRMVALERRLRRYLLREKPRVLVLVDFGAFNVRLGRWARRHGIPTVYLMPPGSWRKQPSPKRLARLVEAADLFLSPFAWNAEHLKAAGASAVHIGHPVLDLAAPSPYAAEMAERTRPEKGRLIALLPGSRRHEVEALAPLLIEMVYAWPYEDDRFVMVQAPSFSDAEFMAVLRDRLPPGWHAEARRHSKMVQAFMSGRREDDLEDDEREELEELMVAYRPRFSIVDGGTADVFHVSDMAVVCAGTATLEGAVAGKPMVVVYDGPWLMQWEWRLRRKRVNARFIGMPNIIAGKEIVPELVAENATVDNIVATLKAFADDPVKRQVTMRMLEKVRGELRPEGALMTAAATIAQAIGL